MIKSSTYFPSFQRVCGWCKQTRINTEWTLEPLSEHIKVGFDVFLALKGLPIVILDDCGIE